jgi:putative restriction endonuclease
VIGCIAIVFPTFFEPSDWVEVPSDWKSNIVSGRTYDLETGPGRLLWDRCARRAAPETPEATEHVRYGAPRMIAPRLGQGGFRLAVLDAYHDACAVTGERSLPVLDAAHIIPYGRGGEHEVSNGISLRRDLHRLFDLGFVTIRRDHTIAVSRRLGENYADGRAYYALDGHKLQLPDHLEQRPALAALEWHGDVVFRG